MTHRRLLTDTPARSTQSQQDASTARGSFAKGGRAIHDHLARALCVQYLFQRTVAPHAGRKQRRRAVIRYQDCRTGAVAEQDRRGSAIEIDYAVRALTTDNDATARLPVAEIILRSHQPIEPTAQPLSPHIGRSLVKPNLWEERKADWQGLLVAAPGRIAARHVPAASPADLDAHQAALRRDLGVRRSGPFDRH